MCNRNDFKPFIKLEYFSGLNLVISKFIGLKFWLTNFSVSTLKLRIIIYTYIFVLVITTLAAWFLRGNDIDFILFINKITSRMKNVTITLNQGLKKLLIIDYEMIFMLWFIIGCTTLTEDLN